MVVQTSRMKTLFLTISRGSLIRNFFYTGIIRKILDRGVRVVVITPYYNHPTFNKFKHKNLLFEKYIEPKKRFQKFFTELQKGALFNKTVRIRYKYRVTGRPPSRFLYYVRLFFIAPVKFVPGIKNIIRFIESRINPAYDHDNLFKKYSPNLVLATAAVNDAPLIKSAKRFGVPAVDMPKSWDNLSKMLFPVKADYLIVWNKFMKEQALLYQGYKDEKILITGVPQFDFYHDKRRLMQRKEFCESHAIDPAKKIILYASTGGNCVDEVPYIKLLNAYIEKGVLPNTVVLVRPHVGHPNDIERFNEVKDLENIVIDESNTQDSSFKDHWDVSEENINGLFNSLYHSRVCINIASTMTLDALAVGKDVININFDVVSTNPHWSTKRLYKSDYIEAITNTCATYVALSEEEFKAALMDVLVSEKNQKKEEKEYLTNYLMYKNDGRSSERLAETVITLINKS